MVFLNAFEKKHEHQNWAEEIASEEQSCFPKLFDAHYTVFSFSLNSIISWCIQHMNIRIYNKHNGGYSSSRWIPMVFERYLKQIQMSMDAVYGERRYSQQI